MCNRKCQQEMMMTSRIEKSATELESVAIGAGLLKASRIALGT
jgi:hypothetical protein